MNTLERCKVVEALGPTLNNAEWRELLYILEDRYSRYVIDGLIKYMAVKKPDVLKAAWPLDKEMLKSVLKNEKCEYTSFGCLAQDAVDALLRGLNGGEISDE